MTSQINKPASVFAWLTLLALPSHGEIPNGVSETVGSETHGVWSVSASNGYSGEISITPRTCHYAIHGGFSGYSGGCYVLGDRIDGLTIDAISPGGSYATPSYQDQSGYSSNGANASTPSEHFTIQLDEFGTSWMKGHIIGLGGNTHVTLRKQ